jgi:hypothetical protein
MGVNYILGKAVAATPPPPPPKGVLFPVIALSIDWSKNLVVNRSRPKECGSVMRNKLGNARFEQHLWSVILLLPTDFLFVNVNF